MKKIGYTNYYEGKVDACSAVLHFLEKLPTVFGEEPVDFSNA